MQCFMVLQVGKNPHGTITFELFVNDLPKTCENFKALCTGEKSTTKQKMCYVSTKIHKVVKNFMAQGGDLSHNDGKGSGVSIYGPMFKDESFKYKHNQRGLLSMANRGPDTNSSQFFITFVSCPWLDKKNVVFGKVISGFDVLDLLETVSTDSGVPKQLVRVHSCGLVNQSINILNELSQSNIHQQEQLQQQKHEQQQQQQKLQQQENLEPEKPEVTLQINDIPNQREVGQNQKVQPAQDENEFDANKIKEQQEVEEDQSPVNTKEDKKVLEVKPIQ